MGAMPTITPTLRGRLFAAAAALSLVATMASCGNGGRPESAAPAAPAEGGSSPGTAAAQSPGTTAAAPPSGTPSPTASPTPGKGPACAAVRCTSVLVTGDMLVNAQLWEQA